MPTWNRFIPCLALLMAASTTQAGSRAWRRAARIARIAKAALAKRAVYTMPHPQRTVGLQRQISEVVYKAQLTQSNKK
jgi:hypothetical protein